MSVCDNFIVQYSHHEQDNSGHTLDKHASLVKDTLTHSVTRAQK